MSKLDPDRRRRRRRALALACGFWLIAGPASGGDKGWNYAYPDNFTTKKPPQATPKARKQPCTGTLGYGPPGLHPGFQGFGLGYLRGYGFGGAGLGTTANGGYPFYGGPGYPHPWPTLNRLGPITPFPYYGGPGGPSPDCPNFFGQVGPLEPDKPVVDPEGAPAEAPGGAFGSFTGLLPYPESTFAPYSSGVGGESGDGNSERSQDGADDGSAASSITPPTPPPPPPPPPGFNPAAAAEPRHSFGIDTEPSVAGGQAQGLKVTRVIPGTIAARSGLAAGDTIQSANGYLTQDPAHLDRVIANMPADQPLKLVVRTARDGEVRSLATKLR